MTIRDDRYWEKQSKRDELEALKQQHNATVMRKKHVLRYLEAVENVVIPKEISEKLSFGNFRDRDKLGDYLKQVLQLEVKPTSTNPDSKREQEDKVIGRKYVETLFRSVPEEKCEDESWIANVKEKMSVYEKNKPTKKLSVAEIAMACQRAFSKA